MDEKTREARSRAGKARAKALTAEQRKAIARNAARARWDENVPIAVHGSSDNPLRLGEIEIPCWVLSDGKRVLHHRGMVAALGMSRGGSSRGGGDRLAHFTAQKALQPFVSGGLLAVTEKPLRFRTKRGAIAYGYEATVLADICNAVLAADKARTLQKQQFHIAERCSLLVRAFSQVGIVALVDEVTGHQDSRDRQALQEFLDRFLRKELAAWAKTFPDEFYRHIFRLRGWEWKGMSINRPQVVAHYTKDFIYARLAPGVLKELENRNPKDERGTRKARHFQWLTEDVGHPALAQHLYAVIGFMRVSETWDQFVQMLDRAFPKRGDTLQLSLLEDITDSNEPVLLS